MMGNHAMVLCAVALAGVGAMGALGTGMGNAIQGEGEGHAHGVAASAHTAVRASGGPVVSREAGICFGPCAWVKDKIEDITMETAERVVESPNVLEAGLGAIKDHVLSPVADGLSGEGCSGFSPGCLLGRVVERVTPDELWGPAADFIFEKAGILAGWTSDLLDRTGGVFDVVRDALDLAGFSSLSTLVGRIESGLGVLGKKLGEFERLSDEWSGRCTMDLGIDIVDEQVPPANRTGGTRYTTFNQANGRSPCFRKGSMRAHQAEYLSKFDSDVLAFQEVDHHNQRSGGSNTALEVIRVMHPAFNAFLDESRYVEVGPGESCPTVKANQACMQHLADGSTIYRTNDGSLVFGPASEKQNLGDSSDINFNALGKSPFGNATYLSQDHQLVDAYTVNFAPPDFPENEKRIWDMNDAELAARNRKVGEAAELWGAQESRAAMVTTIKQPDGTEQTVFNVHLGGRSDGMDYKAAELALLSDMIAHERSLGRQVVLLGDCNVVADAGKREKGETYAQRRDEERLMDKFLSDAGLVLAGGGEGSGVGTIDQIWVSADQQITDHGQYGTGGASDHRKAISVTTE